MPLGRAFADPDITPADFSSFSKQEISADSAAKAIEQLEPIPPVRNTVPMDLSSVIGATATQAIQNAGKITFHTVGDTGGIHSPQFQFAVAEAMAGDVSSGAAFWYHLGDVVYYFGQEQYYFEQFFDPYRNYNAPIFAIPGNHDGAVFAGEGANSLDAFVANFCAAQPARTIDSQGAVRTTMDQPGVYFTLNAPFVKFIGLYSNTSEGGTEGVISGPTVGDAQLVFLQQQLTAAKAERAAGQNRALIIATHHPPFTGSPQHVPSPTMLKQIDQVCAAVGIQPDLHMSGHSHLYERYTRTVNGKQIPYLVAGMGGFYNLIGLKSGKRPPAPQAPMSGTDASNNPLKLEVYNDKNFGFARLSVTPTEITGVFVTVDPATGKTGTGDSFTLDLTNYTVSNKVAKSGTKSAAPKKTPTTSKSGTSGRRS
ncbi:MAG TPA: metallophosphoesterase [Candidatus Acidoferrales bacterium]|nr:metallophosphoesterase [Candidatus Acidoferrales bacterium]